jgi:hypothetical protein
MKTKFSDMKYLNQFKKFIENAVAERETEVKPDKTKTKPGTRPQRPSPFPTERPGQDDMPDPKAKLKKSTEEEVVSKFADVVEKEDVDLKKYFPDV